MLRLPSGLRYRRERLKAMAAKSGPGFIHLRVHSAYSLLEGALPVKALAKLAAKDAQPALAITDRNNLFGALEIAETLAGAGIQPITGCTLALRTTEAEADAGVRKTRQRLGLPDRRVRSRCWSRTARATAISCRSPAPRFWSMPMTAPPTSPGTSWRGIPPG